MIVILNNKCNLLMDEFIKYQSKLSNIRSNHNLVLCPSSLYLSKFYLDNFDLGSQNVSSYYEGAYTGEIAASQLKELGVKYCLVGHSERRKYQKETGQDINRKVKMLLDNEIIPILCVGENLNEKEENMTIVKVLNEIRDAFAEIDDTSKIIIAYEPIWTIGTGITLPRDAIDNIFKLIKQDYPQNLLVYGGGISEENIEELKLSTYIDGYLLGDLSLKVEQFKEFMDKINEGD